MTATKTQIKRGDIVTHYVPTLEGGNHAWTQTATVSSIDFYQGETLISFVGFNHKITSDAIVSVQPAAAATAPAAKKQVVEVTPRQPEPMPEFIDVTLAELQNPQSRHAAAFSATVLRIAKRAYLVVSGTTKKRYRVEFALERGQRKASCNCLDFINKRRVCKHIARAANVHIENCKAENSRTEVSA